MTKQTKRIKNKFSRHDRTKRYGGSPLSQHPSEQRKGIFDILGDTLSNYTGKVVTYAKEKGLRLAGLEPIKKDISTTNDITNDTTNKLGEQAKKVGSDIVNVFDKGSAAVIANINDVLNRPQINTSVKEAASETAAIGEKLLDNFNEKFSSPEIKEEAKEALENAADYAEIAVEALDEPINKAMDELNAAGTKAASGIASGAIKVGTDALAAVPGIGAVIELGKMANDATAAAGDVVEAASHTASTLSKVVEDTSKNIEEGVEKLEEEKQDNATITENNPSIMKGGLKEINKIGNKIFNRVNSSINMFENPLQKKGTKTKRRGSNYKSRAKSKRVRFAI